MPFYRTFDLLLFATTASEIRGVSLCLILFFMGSNEKGRKPESRWTMEQDTAVAVLVEQVTSLKSRLEALEKDVQSKFDRIETKLDEALNAVRSGRPTWAVAMLIAGLMTASSGMAVFIITKGVR